MRESPHPLAAILACLVPGLGHLWLRQPRRASMVFLGITSMTLGGLLIGGIDAIDRREDTWWFVGQAGIGPMAWALDAWGHSRSTINEPPLNARQDWFDRNEQGRTKSLAHSNEIGSLWIVIAGMINAIAVIDAFWHVPPAHTRKRRAEDAQ